MNFQSLIEAINVHGVVSGLTHDFYRYPARFSPAFARAAIELFTEPGDTVLDPFLRSSTSLVESLALGRLLQEVPADRRRVPSEDRGGYQRYRTRPASVSPEVGVAQAAADNDRGPPFGCQ